MSGDPAWPMASGPFPLAAKQGDGWACRSHPQSLQVGEAVWKTSRLEAQKHGNSIHFVASGRLFFAPLPQLGKQILDKDTKVFPSCGSQCIQHELGDTCGPAASLVRATNERDSGNSSCGPLLVFFPRRRGQSSLCFEILGLGDH